MGIYYYSILKKCQSVESKRGTVSCTPARLNADIARLSLLCYSISIGKSRVRGFLRTLAFPGGGASKPHRSKYIVVGSHVSAASSFFSFILHYLLYLGLLVDCFQCLFYFRSYSAFRLHMIPCFSSWSAFWLHTVR